MIDPRHFGWSVDGHVATITLDRPERKNPLTFESYAELTETFRALAQDRERPATNRPSTLARGALSHAEGRPALRTDANDVRAVVITGTGGNFCSGGDVGEIIGPLVEMAERGDRDGLLRFTTMTGDLVKSMRNCPQPIVAAIDGICAGAGAILAMASDLRIGTPRSRVGFLFVRVGLSGADMGACAILPRIIGQGRASELLYTGRFMDGAEAERWGFYNALAEPDAVLATRDANRGNDRCRPHVRACRHQEESARRMEHERGRGDHRRGGGSGAVHGDA